VEVKRIVETSEFCPLYGVPTGLSSGRTERVPVITGLAETPRLATDGEIKQELGHSHNTTFAKFEPFSPAIS
jgi:hypothetical protein